MQKGGKARKVQRPQRQEPPGKELKMRPQPVSDKPVKGSGKLRNKVALITGGDSGIGKAVAILFAKEGADVAISYLNERDDAKDTKRMVEAYGKNCFLIAGDIRKERNCTALVRKTVEQFGRIDILVNNAAMQIEAKTLEDVKTSDLIKTFETNIFSMFWITKAVLPSMKKGGSIINTTSVTAYRGSPTLIPYASTKGAIVAFTRSLSANLAEKSIRVNAVAPGPIWTPLIVSSFDPKKVAKHGSDVPLKRPGEPAEVAPCYLFLASDDSNYMTGQVLHPNGGEIVNG
ncbi:MAG TPA: SDR family oxidoreductase [Chitinophagaceae bacterium]|jgi:NAD(P)-dependent dehydrogenase (short-subunit alcohol dehydrogenase family)|nr:SDR family oxidoreductase [Chitinophagaceae bacterium]